MRTFRTALQSYFLNGRAKPDSAIWRVARERHQLILRLLLAQRTKCGLTQQALADKMGRSRSFVSRYESGKRSLSVVEFVELAEAMDFDVVAMLRQVER